MKPAALATIAMATMMTSCSYSFGHTYPGTRRYTGIGMDAYIAEGVARRTAEDRGERGLPVYSSGVCFYLAKIVLAGAAGAIAAAKPSEDNIVMAAGLTGLLLVLPNCSVAVGYGDGAAISAPSAQLTPVVPVRAAAPPTSTIDGAEYGPAWKAPQ